MSTRLPYVSHIVLNAGVASFHTINFWQCITQLFTRPMAAITSPEFYSQHSGEISADNLGWIWQSNVFGHFVLVCCLSNWPRPTSLMTLFSFASSKNYLQNRLSSVLELFGVHLLKHLQDSMTRRTGNLSKLAIHTRAQNMKST